MKHLKYLKTFEFYSDEQNKETALTYTPNGQHIWDENDTILSLFYFRMREKNSSFDDVNSKIDFDRDNFERDLQNTIGLTGIELAEDIIGCSEGALVTNSLVTEFYVTGRETGRKNGNYYQVNMSEELKNASIEELKPMVENIIDKIDNDETRLAQNKKAKEIRVELQEVNRLKRENQKKAKSLEDKKQMELEKDLKSANVSNATSLSNVEGAEIELGATVNHPKFGMGEVIDSTEKMSIVKFADGEEKVLANGFLVKFIQ